MTIASVRAQAIAEILWELKRAGKLATLTSIAEHVGFSPGSGGRTVSKLLVTVRREWPHLQWWRAVTDEGLLDDEQATFLVEGGFETEPAEGEEEGVVVKSLSDHLMSWEETTDEQEKVESETDA